MLSESLDVNDIYESVKDICFGERTLQSVINVESSLDKECVERLDVRDKEREKSGVFHWRRRLAIWRAVH